MATAVNISPFFALDNGCRMPEEEVGLLEVEGCAFAVIVLVNVVVGRSGRWRRYW